MAPSFIEELDKKEWLPDYQMTEKECKRDVWPLQISKQIRDRQIRDHGIVDTSTSTSTVQVYKIVCNFVI